MGNEDGIVHRRSFFFFERMCTQLEVELTSRDNTEDRKHEDVIKCKSEKHKSKLINTTCPILSHFLSNQANTKYGLQHFLLHTKQNGPDLSVSQHRTQSLSKFPKKNYMFGKSNKRQQTFPCPKPRVFSVESELENKINTNI